MRIALLTLLLVFPVLSRAQGVVQFLNFASTLLMTNDLQGHAGLTSGVNAYRIGFYMAPSGTTDPSVFTLVGPTAINQTGNANGRFNGGSSFVIPNNVNQTIAFQVRAWSIFAGASYEEAALYPGPETVYVGSSAIGFVTPDVSFGRPVPPLFGVGPGLVGGFELTPRIIPEPSTWALVVVGAGVFWCATRARSRKRMHPGPTPIGARPVPQHHFLTAHCNPLAIPSQCSDMVQNNPSVRPSKQCHCRQWCVLLIFVAVAFADITRAAQDSLTGVVSTAFPNPFPASGEEFGCAIASVGTNKLLIGARNDHGGVGAAYLYSHDGTLLTAFTNLFLQSTIPNPSQSGASFGFAVAGLGEGRVAIGAPSQSTSAVGDGTACLYNIEGTRLVTFTNPAPANGDKFGSTIAIVGGDKVLIGAYLADIGQFNGGAAYLFSTNGELLRVFTNSPSFGFGHAVSALGAEHVLVGVVNLGRPGQVHLFHIDGTLVTTFTNPAATSGDHFGWSLAGVGSDKVLIGASYYSNSTGQAYLFSTNGTLLTTFTNPAPWRWVGDEFGRSVTALGPDKVLISSHRNDAGGGNDGGVVHVFSHDATLLTTLTNPTPPGVDFFGYGLAPVGTDKVAVGAICRVVENYPGAGAAYLLNLTDMTPALRLEQLGNNEVCISWPAPATGFVLDTASLASPYFTNMWSQVPFPYQTNGGRISILSGCSGQKFYRLRKP